MPITSVFTDQTEYSRYHDEISTINATIIVSNPVTGTPITASLNRLDGYGTVCSKTVTEAAGQTNYAVSFDLNKDTYDTSNIYRAKAGDYTIQASENGAASVSSSMFAISIVPVVELKTEWIKGVTLMDFEILKPRLQPQQITGAFVSEVSANHFKGPFTLAYTPVNGSASATLAWAGGQAVNISGSAPYQLMLLDSRNEDFIMVDVSPLELPANAVNETLYIDNGRMSDRAIIRQVRRAQKTIETELQTYLEPCIVDTDPNGAYYDEIGIPETYYRPTTFNKWMSFKLPFPNLLDAQITAYFNQSKTADVPRGWTNWNERTGIVELVPSTSVQVIWNFYNGIFMLQYLFNYDSIPGFWHYRVTTGLRDLNDWREIVREAIAKKSSLEILNSAGSSYRAGFASQATSRDGVSQSESYTSTSTMGTYSGHFVSYKEWLKDNLPKIKKRVIGLQFVTI